MRGCRVCREDLTENNWCSTGQKYRNYICNTCMQRYDRSRDRRDDPIKVRDRHLKKSHGINHEIFMKMLELQSLCCGICGKYWPDDESERYWCTDHDHETGIIRGILCNYCNQGMKYIDNLEWLTSALEWKKKGNG